MLGLIIFSGIFTIVVGDIICGSIISKACENRGYVGCREINNSVSKKMLGFVLNFIPIVNIFATLIAVYYTSKLLSNNEEEKKKFFEKTPNLFNAVKAKKIIDNKNKLYDEEEIKDAMKIDGATEKEIKKQINLMNKEKPTICSNKYIKKVNAMSEAELWLQSIYMDAGLSLEEKKELFSGYTNDFMVKKPIKKSKILEKTIRMANTHEYK